jgi:hypothetical protein
MAVFSKATSMRRRGLLGLSVLAVVLTIGVGLLLWQAVELSSVSRVSAQVNRLKPFAGGVRLALIGLAVALWPAWVRLAYRYGRVDEGRRDDLLAQRWRVLGWLLVIGLLLGQNLLGQLFAVTTGPLA